MKLIDKDALVAEIERLRKNNEPKEDKDYAQFELDVSCGYNMALDDVEKFLDTLEVKWVDIDKLCEFRKNIGFAYPEGARECQKQLACYRQGIEDAIKAQKGEGA